jgi:hypothetical protein
MALIKNNVNEGFDGNLATLNGPLLIRLNVLRQPIGQQVQYQATIDEILFFEQLVRNKAVDGEFNGGKHRQLEKAAVVIKESVVEVIPARIGHISNSRESRKDVMGPLNALS